MAIPWASREFKGSNNSTAKSYHISRDPEARQGILETVSKYGRHGLTSCFSMNGHRYVGLGNTRSFFVRTQIDQADQSCSYNPRREIS